MYEVFDNFIRRDTWHTRHPNDVNLFMLALNKVVWNEDFSPDEMRTYLDEKLGIDQRAVFAAALDNYTSYAWGVKDFIKYCKIERLN